LADSRRARRDQEILQQGLVVFQARLNFPNWQRDPDFMPHLDDNDAKVEWAHQYALRFMAQSAHNSSIQDNPHNSGARQVSAAHGLPMTIPIVSGPRFPQKTRTAYAHLVNPFDDKYRSSELRKSRIALDKEWKLVSTVGRDGHMTTQMATYASLQARDQQVEDLISCEKVLHEQVVAYDSGLDATTQPRVIPFNGKRFGTIDSLANPTNLSAVLARETIWCVDGQVPWHSTAPWPCQAEFDWEGDARLSTENGRFGRCIPIPRLPSHWPGWHEDYKECQVQEIYPFDRVAQVPSMEDLIAPVDEIEERDVIASLLNTELWDELETPNDDILNNGRDMAGVDQLM
jgi:hypothetical protein